MSRSLHPSLLFGLLALVAIAVVPLIMAMLATPHESVGLVSPSPMSPQTRSPIKGSNLTRPVLGVAINAHHICDLDLYLQSVDEIADLGANSLILTTPMFQEDINSNQIRYLPDKCPTDEQLQAILRRANQRGLSTTLLPIVLVENTTKKEWRGVIEPTDWNAWWASYEKMLDRFLTIANACEVVMFGVGSELNSTESQRRRWEHIVQHVRSHYDGKLTYSANWDRYNKANLWDLVDVMAVSSYFEIGRGLTDPTVEDLAESWQRERTKLLAYAKSQDLPLLLSEVGYPSLPWAAQYPWNYVADDETADHKAQARCYEAFFRVWTETVAQDDTPAIGFFCYSWDPYHRGQSHDTGYGIDGKPAERIVRQGFTRIRDLSDLHTDTPQKQEAPGATKQQ